MVTGVGLSGISNRRAGRGSGTGRDSCRYRGQPKGAAGHRSRFSQASRSTRLAARDCCLKRSRRWATSAFRLIPVRAFPFSGIRFSDDTSSASARFSRGSAFGLRRTTPSQPPDRARNGIRRFLSVGLANYRTRFSRRFAEWFACSVPLDCRRGRPKFHHSQASWPRCRPPIFPLRIPPAFFGCSVD